MPSLITGANGQLGHALQQLMPDAIVTDREELDITSPDSVAAFNWSGIDAIYNAAAYTSVDKAEQTGQVIPAWNLNASAVAHLAMAAKTHRIPLVHVSTDYVFAGNASKPYPEDAPINPQGMYGRTKAAGDLAATIAPRHYIIRTSWVYGEGANFVRTIMKLGAERSELTVVDDQLGRPTYAKDLASALVYLVTHQANPGIYHFQNSGGIISWADFATTIMEYAGIDCTITPVTTAQYLEGKLDIAPRPAYGALALDKITDLGVAPRPWQEALKEYIQQELQ